MGNVPGVRRPCVGPPMSLCRNVAVLAVRRDSPLDCLAECADAIRVHSGFEREPVQVPVVAQFELERVE